MVDKHHLSLILRQDQRAWNRWREQHWDMRPDLAGADLSNSILTEANLDGADLTGANLTEARLARANLRGAALTGASLAGACLARAKLNAADLTGADLADADLASAILDQAKLAGTNFAGADLTYANIGNATLTGANLTGADLTGSNLFYSSFAEANLTGAILIGAALYNADLTGATLTDADLREATATDAVFDHAQLTGVRLWELRRGGWSIRGINCRRAFWDRAGIEPSDYGEGEFEHLYREKPRIRLRYPGGISLADLAMLPLIIQRLQANHPDCGVRVSSLEDGGSGAIVTITVEDLADRNAEAFKAEIQAVRVNLGTLQQRLQQEERLRLTFEAKYEAIVNDVLPMLTEHLPPKQEINIGRLTGPSIIEGTSMNRNSYSVQGQAAAVGPGAQAHENTLQQFWSQEGLDLPKLAAELATLRSVLRESNAGTVEQDAAMGELAQAETAAVRGDGPTALGHLRNAGSWVLGVAEKIGVPIAVEALKRGLFAQG